MSPHRLFASLGLLLLAAGLDAQAADLVRGRVTDDASRAVAGASVIITRGPDRLIQTTTTDAEGRYSSRFEPGTGDYLVNVTSLGYRSARRRVQRAGSERELVADFILARDLATLAKVNVTASRPVRASASVSPTTVEAGANEQWSNGVNGRVTPGAAGDLNALAGTMPGVTMTASGPSILGAASTSNLTTLNGMALPGGSLPRAARTETRVTGATFDPTRGGFAGANIDVRLGPGDRTYQQRNAFLTFDAPALQMTDAVGRSLGLVNGGFRASVGADGEAIRRVLSYNVSLDVAHNASTPATLLGGDTGAWRRAGVAPDSVTRLLLLAGQAGIPLGGTGIPGLRKRDGVTYLGRFDDVLDSLRTLTLTTYAGINREGALGVGPLASPAAGGESNERTFGAQFIHSAFVGKGHYVLRQNRLPRAVSASRRHPTRTCPARRCRCDPSPMPPRATSRRSRSAATHACRPTIRGGRWKAPTRPCGWPAVRSTASSRRRGRVPTASPRRDSRTGWASTRSTRWPTSRRTVRRRTPASSSSPFAPRRRTTARSRWRTSGTSRAGST